MEVEWLVFLTAIGFLCLVVLEDDSLDMVALEEQMAIEEDERWQQLDGWRL